MATKKPGGMTWLETIELKPDRSLATEAAIVRTLTKELTEALAQQNFAAIDLTRCVYVIRMKGDFVIAYPKRRSPVLYICLLYTSPSPRDS